MRPSLFSLPFLLLPSAAFAQDVPSVFDFDVTPPFRGAASAEYAGWNVFTVPFGGVNLPDDTAADLASSIEQLSTSAIITSTMNIYNPSGVSEFVFDIAAAGPANEVVLQLRTLGNPLDAGSFELVYDAAGAPVSVPPTTSQVLSPGSGFAEETLYSWDLGSLVDDVTSFQILFSAVASNCSLDAAMVDVSSDFSIGSTYCTANANSTGVTGDLAVLGSIVAGDNEIELVSSSLPANVFGLYIASQDQASVSMPGGSMGILCLGSEIGRFGSQIFLSSGSGSNTTSVDLTQMPTPTGPVAVVSGETWNFQCWHRDTGAVATSNFTLPVSVTFQ